MRRFGIAVLLACALSGQEPSFRAGARLVQVDVVVRDKNGPVAGLTKDDFTLQDDGKGQAIAVFSVTASATAGATRTPEATRSEAPSPKAADVPPVATILLIDRLNTPVASQLYANQRIIKFLQTRKKKDPVGIFVLGTNLRVVQDLTQDTDRLDRAVKGLGARSDKRLTTDGAGAESTGDAVTDQMMAHSLEDLENFVISDRSRVTSGALIDIARRLKSVPGRKNLVWVSAGFPLFVVREHTTLNFTDDVTKAARALTDANVAIYPVDARGLGGNTAVPQAELGGQSGGSCLKTGEPCQPPSGDRGGPTGIDTMNTIAGLTGGRAFYNTNGIDDSIEQATNDAAITYTLGFYPAVEPDETFHRLNVKVTGKGRDVRFRRGYYAAKP